jgi:diaminopimelate epimerase
LVHVIVRMFFREVGFYCRDIGFPHLICKPNDVGSSILLISM